VRKNREKLLLVAAIGTLVIALANGLEYYLSPLEYLREVTGKVEEITHKTDERNTSTTLKIDGEKFWLKDRIEEGGYIDAAEGDTLKLYVKRSYQYLYAFGGPGNIFYVAKHNKMLYNNTAQWKGPARQWMMRLGICSILLWFIYFDQVRNISISNRVQRRRTK